MVAVILCGPSGAGKSEVANILQQKHGYQRINLRTECDLDSFQLVENEKAVDLSVGQAETLIMTQGQQHHFVVDAIDASGWEILGQRPCCLLVAISREGCPDRADSLLPRLIIHNDGSVAELEQILIDLNMQDPAWLRPPWDDYFMEMAQLVSLRSNCLKRRVGAIIVANKRVMATGYNGTPIGLPNCNEGGCTRCSGNARCGHSLDSCICLHAEENALLEHGSLRHLPNPATLYCTMSPCFGCSKKLIQVGIKRVVYAKQYSLEHDTRQMLQMAGVTLEQYRPTLPRLVRCKKL